jgi:hypothetical protein
VGLSVKYYTLKIMMAALCLAMWWFVLSGSRLAIVPGAWGWEEHLFADVVVGILVLAMSFVVRVVEGSWIWALTILIPFWGVFISVRAFWIIGGVPFGDSLSLQRRSGRGVNSAGCEEHG